MSIFGYTQELPTSFNSAEIRESLANNAKANSGLGRLLENIVFTNKDQYPADLKAVNELIMSTKPKEVRLGTDNTVTGYMGVVVNNLNQLIPLLQQELNNKFRREVSNVALTYNKVSYLQIVEIVDFAIKYIYNYLDVLLALVINRQINRPTYEGLGPDDVQWIKNNANKFASIADILAKPVTTVAKLLEQAPDMVVSEDEAAVRAVVGSKVDPLGFANLPWPFSLVYELRLQNASRKMDLYEARQETEKVIERRVLLYKQAIENGTGDAALEKSLAVQESRLLKLKRRIEKTEAKYALHAN